MKKRRRRRRSWDYEPMIFEMQGGWSLKERSFGREGAVGNVTLCPRLGNWGLVNFFAYGYISGSGMRWN